MKGNVFFREIIMIEGKKTPKLAQNTLGENKSKQGEDKYKKDRSQHEVHI